MFKKLLLLTILLGMLVVSCTPSDSGAEIMPTPTAADEEDVSLALRIQVKNATPQDLDQVTLIFANSEVTFRDLPAGASSPFQTVSEAYQSVAVEIGEGELQTLLDQGLERGEASLTAGAYTYVIQAGADLADAYVDVRPHRETSLAALQELIVALEADGAMVEWQPSLQRGTPFDDAYGQTISAREILLVNGGRVDVYYFAEAAMAELMAGAIQPGGTQLVVERPDGSPGRASLLSAAGSAPTWWHEGRYVLTYPGDDPAVLSALAMSLAEPLLAQAEGAVEVRVANIGQVPFDSVQVNFAGQDVDYGALEPFELSAYRPVNEAYRYGSIKLETLEGPFDLMAIDYVGETALPAGRYTYYLEVAKGGLNQTMIADDPWHSDARLLDRNWYWVATFGEQQPVADRENGQGSWPYISFTTDVSPNDGEVGWLFGGFTSCNGMGGTYFTNPDQALVIAGIGQNEAGCRPEVAASEAFFTDFWRGITYYHQQGEWLFVTDGAGNRLVLTSEEPAGPAPYGREEAAALGPLLTQLWPETDMGGIERLPEAPVAAAVAWELTLFRETVTVLVYDNEEAVLAGRGFVPAGRAWTTDRYLLIYDGEYDLVADVLDDLFDQVGQIGQ